MNTYEFIFFGVPKPSFGFPIFGAPNHFPKILIQYLNSHKRACTITVESSMKDMRHILDILSVCGAVVKFYEIHMSMILN